MKKKLLFLVVIGLISCGLTANAHQMHGHKGHPHRQPHHMPPSSLNHVMRPHMMHSPIHRIHRIGCPLYNGFGHRCTCHRYYRGNGIYIDFRVPIVF